MNTILLLLITLPMLMVVLTLWGCLAMASWSDRQIAYAWQEWQETKADAVAAAE